ncbi:MAG: hypothetical protein M3Q97_05280 [Bacteroidota bacterium]|nr:hypothetical protein [Bacteroidota bacterium]
MKKITKLGILLVFALSVGCNGLKNDEPKSLILLDGTVFHSPKIKDFQIKKDLKFKPYTGIYYKSEIDGKNVVIILFTEKTEDLTNPSNLYNDDGKSFEEVYSKIEDDNITALGLCTFTPKGEGFWNPILDSYEKNLGISIVKEPIENGAIWKHKDKKLLSIKYHAQNKSLLELKIYPIEKEI